MTTTPENCDAKMPRPKPSGLSREELNRRGWTETELAARRKNDPAKLAIAARIRHWMRAAKLTTQLSLSLDYNTQPNLSVR